VRTQFDGDIPEVSKRVRPGLWRYLSALFFCAHALCAQELRIVAETRIPLGPGPGQVGVERSEGEFWAPLFFAVDPEGLIHVADFYKQRIALFNRQGAFVRAVPTPEGVAPAMNYFGRVWHSGLYVTVSDGTLFLLDRGGSVRWRSELDEVPESVYLGRDAIFVLLPADYVTYSYGSPWPLRTSEVPLVRTDTGSMFTMRARDMRELRHWPPGVLGSGSEALFSVADAEGNSLWRERRASVDWWYLADGEGRLLRTGTTPRGDGEPGSGFWGFVGGNLEISRARYTQDAMTVVTHVIR
jgi:hypothetical protein